MYQVCCILNKNRSIHSKPVLVKLSDKIGSSVKSKINATILFLKYFFLESTTHLLVMEGNIKSRIDTRNAPRNELLYRK